jgi:hypothetical protein
MLLQKPIKKGDCVSIKLISGEEILAAYEDETDSHLVVEKPSNLVPGREGGMGIVPWFMSSKAEKVNLSKTTIVAFTRTEDEIAKSYRQATTNITLA